MTNKRRQSTLSHRSGAEEEGSLPPTRVRRRFPTFTVSVVIALLGLVALAPTIVSLTPLGPHLVSSAAEGRIEGSLQAASVSIGWVTPLQLRGVEVQDSSGNVIATVESLTISKSVLGLLSNTGDLGVITLDKPQLVLVTREDGSNLEDLLAPLLEQPASGAPNPAVVVEVKDAKVKLIDGATDEAWEISPVAARLESPPGSETAWRVVAEGKSGESAVKVLAAYESEQTTATIEADRFPLAPLQPILTRLAGAVKISGAFTGKIDAGISGDGRAMKATLENVDAVHISIAAPRYLGGDKLQFEQIKASGSAALSEGVWELRNLDVRSDVAAIAGSGDLRLTDFSSEGIPQSDCDIRGVVDLAKVAAMLPDTLHVRDEVQITRGSAEMSLVSQAAPGGRRFEASLDTSEIQATRDRRSVGLREPLHLAAKALQTERGWQIETLEAKSSFLTLSASGTPESGNLTLHGDMNRLASELDQFLDLRDMRLAGQVNGSAQWRQAADRKLTSSGELNFTTFELAAPGMIPWRENDLAIVFEGRGIAISDDGFGVGGGKLEVRSDADRLDVVLLQGVPSITANSPLPLELRLTGDLATWLPRLQPFVPLAGWRASGPVLLTAKANVSTSRIDVPDGMVNVRELRAAGMGLNIYEPELKGQLKLTYDTRTSAATITDAVVQATSVAAGSEKLVVQMGPDAKIQGDLAARGSVGSLMAWLNDPRTAATSQFNGEAEAELTFTHTSGTTKSQLKGQISDLSYAVREAPAPGVREVSAAAPWETKWTEQLVEFGGDASYNATKDVLSLTKMGVKAGTSEIVISGSVTDLAARCQLDLDGEVKYDLAYWTPKAQSVLGQSFDMYGAGAKAFEVHGPLLSGTSSKAGEPPLLPLALTGKAGLGWQGMQWMAMEVGAAEVSAELKDSTVYVQPSKIPLSQGTLELAPAIVLRGSNWLVVHDEGRVIDHVVVTPQMCSAWLKYVQPLLADATEAQGKFSLDVEKAMIPISQPKTFDGKGTFVMHNVSIGPGPLAREILGVVQQVKDFTDGKIGLDGLASLATRFGTGALSADVQTTGKQWLQFPEQNVPVEVVEGRVYHENLTMHHKEFTLRTTGSVGIQDQTLQLVCEIPIEDKWIEGKSYLAGLKGKSLKIPVQGTITSPRADAAAWTNELKSLALSSVGGALQGGINKGLEKGNSAVQEEIQKGQNKVQEEINKGKQKVEEELRDFFKGFGS